MLDGDQERFVKELKELFDQTSLNDPLDRFRAKAWERFDQTGLPGRHTEVYRSIRLRHLFANQYARPLPINIAQADVNTHLLPECHQSYLVLVNGVYTPELSDTSGLNAKVVVSGLNQAIKSYGTFLNNHWALALKKETDPFAALNGALHLGGLFIYLPPQCDAGPPLQLLSFIEGDQVWALPRVQIMMGKESQATVIASTMALKGSHYAVSQVCDISMEDQAQLNYLHTAYGLSDNGWLFDALRTRLKRHSVFKAIGLTDGAKTVRSDSRITLTGEGGEASISSLWMLAEKREAHAHVLMEHEAPHCRSNQLFKGVLTDISRSSFEGKILVQQAAQKTEAYQLNQNLLLSDNAHADSKPNLEIFADDVKASHGATVGQLDQEQLFYLQARGLAREQAQNLLIAGFAKGLVDQICVPSMRKKAIRQIETYFPG